MQVTKERLWDDIVTAESYLDKIRGEDQKQLQWEEKGPKNTAIIHTQLWLVGQNLIYIQFFRGGGWQPFISSPHNEIDKCVEWVKKSWAK